MARLMSKVGILSKIQGFLPRGLAYRSSPSEELTAQVSAWEEMLEISDPIQWTQTETSVLLDSEKLKPFCHAQFLDSELKAQTVLLGFDLDSNQLLIDDFFPKPSNELMKQGFELMFNARKGSLAVQVEIEEKVFLESQVAFLLKINSKRMVYDRRQNSRVQFSRNTAPKIDLLVPMSEQQKGHLLDLSTAGLTMVSFTRDKLKLSQTSGECTLHLSEHIKIRSKMLVKQVSYSRSPSKHTTLRIIFTDLTDTQKDQLKAFIISFEALSFHAA